MFARIIMFLKGSVQVTVGGFSAERFLNLCSSNDLELFDLVKHGDIYLVTMSLSDYRRARRLARKSHVSLHIVRKNGLPFMLYRNRKRKVWCIGCLLSLFILYGMSLFLWEIQLEGNSYYTKDILMAFLEDEQIRHGMRMSSIRCDELEQKLRVTYPHITWVSAQKNGTRLQIQIKENFGTFVLEEKDESPSDLVADKDGVITEIVTRSGIPMVKAGDSVAKGQILISGKIPILNDGGEITGYQTVPAEGTVHAEIMVPYKYTNSILASEKQIISKGKTGGSVWKSNEYLRLGRSVPQSGMYYTLTEYIPVTIFGSWRLPIWGTRTTEYAYETCVRRLEPEEIAAIADSQFAFYITELEKDGIKLVGEDRIITEDAFSFTDSGSLILEIPLGEKSAIPVEKPELQPDESS